MLAAQAQLTIKHIDDFVFVVGVLTDDRIGFDSDLEHLELRLATGVKHAYRSSELALAQLRSHFTRCHFTRDDERRGLRKADSDSSHEVPPSCAPVQVALQSTMNGASVAQDKSAHRLPVRER
jgi:hypothetical protein